MKGFSVKILHAPLQWIHIDQPFKHALSKIEVSYEFWLMTQTKVTSNFEEYVFEAK